MFMCFKSFNRSRSVSFGVTANIAADGGLLASLIVNCVLMTAAVPIADKTQTSSLELEQRQFISSVSNFKKSAKMCISISSLKKDKKI